LVGPFVLDDKELRETGAFLASIPSEAISSASDVTVSSLRFFRGEKLFEL